MKTRLVPLFLVITLTLVWSAGSLAADLTLNEARQVMGSAIAYARTNGAPGGAIAIVDAGGHLVLLERLDGTFPAGAAISTGKARTAALFRKATRDFEKIINEGRVTMVSLPDVTPFTPLRGGVPLVADGVTYGAIGVSGASSAQQDDEIAQAGADSFATIRVAHAGAGIRHIGSNKVAAAFRAGAPLLENGEFKVHASRREAAGEAEVHLSDTDIFYVLDGAATLITGGELVEPRRDSATEWRGASIRGGTRASVAKGDVIVIPRGVPHWFEQVQRTVTYYVVKASG